MLAASIHLSRGTPYIYMGEERPITRKATLTGLLSDICDDVYSLTPVVNNEAINRNDITAIANNSRSKIIAGLLRNELEHNLGLSGSGQEVSIMRSTLLRTGVLVTDNSLIRIELKPDDELIRNMLTTIISFIQETKAAGSMSFGVLYRRLVAPENHIGLRKGLIPIYLAAVFHEFKQELILQDRFGQVPITADVLLQINANPEGFTLAYLDWDPEKAEFIQGLAEIFSDYVIEAEKKVNAYDYVVSAMKRWYMALPKYTKELKRSVKGKKVEKRYLAMLRLLKNSTGSHELLFDKLPTAFDYTNQFSIGLVENIAAAKKYYDNCIAQLKKDLIQTVKEIFSISQGTNNLKASSLTSVIKDWCESLDEKVFEQLFTDGTERCLGLFKTATNDEETLIARLAKTATDLRLEDWDSSTYESFVTNVKKYKATAEAYQSIDDTQEEVVADAYQVTFVGENGQSFTKRFSRIDYSKRGKLLYNQVTDALDSMGQSISEQEKRQIIMDILKELC